MPAKEPVNQADCATIHTTICHPFQWEDSSIPTAPGCSCCRAKTCFEATYLWRDSGHQPAPSPSQLCICMCCASMSYSHVNWDPQQRKGTHGPALSCAAIKAECGSMPRICAHTQSRRQEVCKERRLLQSDCNSTSADAALWASVIKPCLRLPE